MRIILWDLETAPLEVTSWGLYKPRLSHENIIQGSTLISACWKVYGEREVSSASIKPSSPRDDKALVKRLRDALTTADVLVAHNGDKFDLRHLNARLAFHELEPLPPIKMVDTLKVARKYFRFDSNRLDFLGGLLIGDRKIATSYGLWLDILKGDKAALAKMVRYNEQDVRLLEKVYTKLRPFMTNHPNHRLTDGTVCPICGAKASLQRRGFRMTRLSRSQAFQCQKCGGWSSGKAIDRTEVG